MDALPLTAASPSERDGAADSCQAARVEPTPEETPTESRFAFGVGLFLVILGAPSVLLGASMLLAPHEGQLGAVAIGFGAILAAVGGLLLLIGVPLMRAPK